MSGWTRAALVLVAGLGLGACAAPPIPEFPRYEVTVPDPVQVDELIFLVGDAGASDPERSPILRDLQDRIERWSRVMDRDSAVTVVFLGDNVYPVGVRDRDDPSFPEDSVRLWSQIELLSGPEARRRGSLGVFVAGNHDWGNMTGEAGVERLQNMEEQFAQARSGGIRVRLVPEPGDPGPEVIDLRHNTRLIAVDTHWFLQERSSSAKDEFMVEVLTALQEAGDRHVVMVAHHPYASAGEHGALLPVGEALGLLYLLKKSGTLIQDLNSPVYLDLLARLRTAFTAAGRPPLVWAGGHDHSLQVIEAQSEFEPQYQLVSGSASKVTEIQAMPGLAFGKDSHGYMMLFLLRNGAVALFVVATESDVTACPEEPEADRAACMTEEAERFGLWYSAVLHDPAAPLAEDAVGDASPRDLSVRP